MLCYSCAHQGIHQDAVALCRSCSAGLCLEHLRETAARRASSHVLYRCHHDTWLVPDHPQGATEHPAGNRRHVTIPSSSVVSDAPDGLLRSPFVGSAAKSSDEC